MLHPPIALPLDKIDRHSVLQRRVPAAAAFLVAERPLRGHLVVLEGLGLITITTMVQQPGVYLAKQLQNLPSEAGAQEVGCSVVAILAVHSVSPTIRPQMLLEHLRLAKATRNVREPAARHFRPTPRKRVLAA